MPKLVIDSTPDRGAHWAEQGYNIVAIDVLRATSTIVVALMQGADEVIPCAEVDEAQAFRGRGDIVLAGERKGEIIPGFDYTNSPHDLTTADLTNKRIVLTTSDGTRLITQASKAENVLVASTLNYQAIAQAILGLEGDWALIGAGSSGDFRPEDKVGCALVGRELQKDRYFEINENDTNFINLFARNWEQHILSSLSVEKLRKIGRDVDIDFVIDEVNNFPVKPRAIQLEDRVSIKLL